MKLNYKAMLCWFQLAASEIDGLLKVATASAVILSIYEFLFRGRTASTTSLWPQLSKEFHMGLLQHFSARHSGLKMEKSAIRNCWISARWAIKLHPFGKSAE